MLTSALNDMPTWAEVNFWVGALIVMIIVIAIGLWIYRD